MAILLELEGEEKEWFANIKTRLGIKNATEVVRFAIKHTAECGGW